MFGLAWIFLPDLPLFRDGIIMVGLARCIAMVLVWNMLAGGDNEYAAIIVALNAGFQIALYSIYAYFFITILPVWINPSVSATIVSINPWDIARSVAIFLGVPFAMGIATRYALQGRKKERRLVRRKVSQETETNCTDWSVIYSCDNVQPPRQLFRTTSFGHSENQLFRLLFTFW